KNCAEDPKRRQAGALQKLLRIRDGEISFFAPHEQARQASRRTNFDFDFVPLAVASEIRGPIAYRILMTKLERNLLKNVIHLSATARIKSFAPRDARQLVQNPLALHAKRAADVAAAQNSNRVQHDVCFFEYAAQLVERVTRVVVLAVADQKQRALRMSTALNALDSQIASVIKRGVVLGLDERELVEHGVTVARAIHQKLGARIESNQKIFVAVVTGLNEVGQSIACAMDLVAAHRSRHVEQNSDRNRRVFLAEKSNVLLTLVVENREGILVQPRYKSSVDVSDGHSERDQISVRNDGGFIVNLALRQLNLG